MVPFIFLTPPSTYRNGLARLIRSYIFSRSTFSQYRDWLVTLNSVGVPDSEDAAGGSTDGAYTTTSFINPTNWTRSYSKSAYIDPLPPRDNLAILANATVTRIIFDSSNSNNLTATGVEFASNRDATKRTVKVSKEVILAGGAVGSPHVLLVSGVGPKDTLEAAGVPVLHELNGVGQHMADHLVSQLPRRNVRIMTNTFPLSEFWRHLRREFRQRGRNLG